MKGKQFKILGSLLLLGALLAGCGNSAGAAAGTVPAVSAPVSAAAEETGSAAETLTEGAAAAETLTEGAAPESPAETTAEAEDAAMKMNVQVGDSVFAATLEDNAAVDALVEMMKEAPVTIQMSDYAGFEKVGPLGTSLPASNSQTTTQAGDIVLYQGDQIVIFYGSNSWSYTRLGRIDDLTGWAEALGSGDVTVTFSVEG